MKIKTSEKKQLKDIFSRLEALLPEAQEAVAAYNVAASRLTKIGSQWDALREELEQIMSPITCRLEDELEGVEEGEAVRDAGYKWIGAVAMFEDGGMMEWELADYPPLAPTAEQLATLTRRTLAGPGRPVE